MLTNFDEKFIFLRPGKVAGTSTEMFLQSIFWPKRPVRHEQAWQAFRNGFVTGRMELSGDITKFKNLYALYWSRRYSNLPNYGAMQEATKLGTHAGPNSIREILGEGFWQKSFNVTIVRNPYDAAVSRFFWKARHSLPADLEAARVQFEKYVEQIKGGRINIEIPTSLNLFDHVIRYETLHTDVMSLLDRLGKPLELINSFPTAKAGIRPGWASDYRGLYTIESRRLVEAEYKSAIESMEYTFDG